MLVAYHPLVLPLPGKSFLLQLNFLLPEPTPTNSISSAVSMSIALVSISHLRPFRPLQFLVSPRCFDFLKRPVGIRLLLVASMVATGKSRRTKRLANEIFILVVLIKSSQWSVSQLLGCLCVWNVSEPETEGRRGS